MTNLSIAELIAQKRIAFLDREGAEHMIAVIEYAGSIGRLEELVRAVNYVACRPDEVVLMFRDGRSEEYSFFWSQITLTEFTQGRIEQQKSPYQQFTYPSRQLYHGGLICRKNYDPVSWSVHT